MQALSNKNKDFPLEKVKKLYENDKEYFETPDYPFKSFLKDNTGHLWAFVEDKKLIGYIFMHSFTKDSCKLSGSANRKLSKQVNEAIKGTCGFYFANFHNLQKIYAETIHKHAKIALLRGGFKRLNENTFFIERNQYEQ